MERYTAQMGAVFFEDGLSTADVSHKDATRIAAVYSCEYEDGTNPSVSQFLLDQMHAPAVSTSETSVHMPSSPASTPEGIAERYQDLPDAPAPEPVAGATVWNEADLAKIADEKGIGGLREIADPLNLKNNSIRGLIDAIVNATGGVFEAPQGE
jgi:hypothetical protein